MVNKFESPPEQVNTHPQRWPALWALSAGVLMGTLDMSIVNVALPTLVRELHTNLATVQWVIIIYGMVVTGFMLSMGSLGDLLGKRRVFTWGLVIFTTGSLACALSMNIYMLIAARAFQGLGSVMMQALVAAVITDIFPAEERGRALGAMGAVVSVGLALGPAVGGVLLGVASWHVIFLVNVPLGLASWWAIRRLVPDLAPTASSGRFDYLGTLLLFVALACYALGMTLIQSKGLASPQVLWLLAGGTIGAAAFGWSQRRSSHAMIAPALLKDGQVLQGLLLSFLAFLVLGATFLLPFFLQYGRKFSPTTVGFLMMVAPVGMGLVAPIAGACSDRWGVGGVRLAGLLLVATGCLLVSTMGPEAGVLEFIIKFAPCGLGMGLFQSPNLSAVMGRAPSGQSGAASGIISLTRTLGTITGLPLMGLVFAAHMAVGDGGLGRETVMHASPVALATSLGNTYKLAALIALAAAGLAAWSWLRSSARRANRT